MSTCTDPSYTCPSFGTKPQLKNTNDTSVFTHSENRVFLLVSGGVTLPINTRSRNYTYTDSAKTTRTNGRVIIIGDGEGTAEVDCFDYTQEITGTISEDYTTVDCTFHYADLRTDLFVYSESTQAMKFNQTNGGGIARDGQYGNLVFLSTGYDDVWRIPFIKENVPVAIDNRIICTGIGELFSEHIDSGYWNGIRVLMPLFGESGDIRRKKITIENVEYEAYDVDWYYLPNHRTADGDSYFWWADWHKAVGVNNEIDAAEAEKLAASYLGYIPTPAELTSSDGLVVTGFSGSAAVDAANNIFFSAVFRDGTLKLNRLMVQGTDALLPTEKISVREIDGTYTKKDSEHTCYYPIAPL